jgi:hypothetical protein
MSILDDMADVCRKLYTTARIYNHRPDSIRIVVPREMYRDLLVASRELQLVRVQDRYPITMIFGIRIEPEDR